MPLVAPAILLVFVLPAWETVVWLTRWTFVFFWVTRDTPPFVVCRVFHLYECPPEPYTSRASCSDPLGLRA